MDPFTADYLANLTADLTAQVIAASGRRMREALSGSEEALAPSIRGAIRVPVNQLRDPAIFEEDGRVFLLYAVAGESGIAIAEVFLDG